MRSIYFNLIFVFCMVLVRMSFAYAAEKPLVILSGFDPFGKAKVNLSQKVVEALKLEHSLNAPYDLEICILPTVYDQSFAKLQKCIRATGRSPKLVLSLGEGSDNCEALDFELYARNLDSSSLRDNRHVKRRNKPIINGGVERVELTLAKDFDIENLKGLPIVASDFMGSFVCNNLAYRMGAFVSQSHQDFEKPFSFGFIHVPDHSCNHPEARFSKSTDTLRNLIQKFLSLRQLI